MKQSFRYYRLTLSTRLYSFSSLFIYVHELTIIATLQDLCLVGHANIFARVWLSFVSYTFYAIILCM